MVERFGRWSDQLLAIVVPRTTAAADTCWTETTLRYDCPVGCQRLCSRRCCMLSGCRAWSCGSCFC